MDNEKCDEYVYKNGTGIGVIAGGNSEIINAIIKIIAQESKQKVDWHYVGGRAVVLAVGDIEKAKESFRFSKLQYMDL